ncbi:GH92 family glycosyl hydrolase [Enterovibrio sp. ZSDZ42]|uniref:GH92 family glycosyl hydrolase n=1 Tax=Enterovibrio gelatinilyticus TaxID=2899819 RepID=A0ABT5R2G2_9GAMM|nr:GH92 family glycosyl hydrolase [Enterovibrio sp. ZSDZ42]MDD1794439.1 GH92 family glycosyl hydrolase [Enterovibrio sp. ZSDZ42]
MNIKLAPCALAIALALSVVGCNSDSNTSEPGISIPSVSIIDKAVLKYVDPMIGTAASGHTFPGAVVPAGMVQLSPDTFIGSKADHEAGLNDWHSASGYWDKSDYSENGEIFDTDVPIYGFSHTHLSGTGATDLGDILVLPYSDLNDHSINAFDKSNEIATAGFYKTKLNNGNIDVELTTTKRVGLHKYTFAKGADRNVKFDLGHTLQSNNGKSLKNKIEVIDEYTIRGRKSSTGWFQGQDHQGQDIFFYAKFSQPVASAMLGKDGKEPETNMRHNAVYQGDDLTAFLNFGAGDEAIEIRVGISPVNWHGAQKNLEAEAPTFDFATVKANAEFAWAEKLAKVKVEGGSDAEKTNFYTGMYHMMIAPIEFYDVDGRYVDMLGTTRTLEEGDTPNYSIYSTWDTFRAVHPFWTIIDPKQATLYVEDLIRKSNDEFGMLPKWEGHGSETGTMIGYPSTAILGDAVTKGLVDAEEALEASVKSAHYRPHDFPQINDGILGSLMAGQLSYHIGETCVRAPNWNSVSYSLEFSFYDWTIAEMAKAAGDMETYDEFKARSYNSLTHWDPSVGFFVPTELKDGDPCAFKYSTEAFSPYKADAFYFTEGNAWQWQWAFMQDLDKLTEIMGGTEGLNEKLNNLFTADENEGDQHQDMTGYIGQYIHGNEPSHHVIYLYNRTEESYKAQEYLDQVYDEFYKPTPDGIIGNEDVGQMSAWYLMSSLGFYQISPTDPTYSIGRPIFDKATMSIGEGKFTVIAENNGPDNMYVKSVTINGKPLDKFNTFKHEEFKAGGELRFVMTADKSEAMAANL